MYTETEKYLEPLVVGLSRDPVDPAVVGKLNDNLISTLQNLLDAVRSGAAAKQTDDPVLQAAIARYLQYVSEQSRGLVEQTTLFTQAVKDGKFEEAKRLYAVSRVYYERIEPIAESFGDLDPRIDARENDVDGEWTGFHVLEKAVWAEGSLEGQGKIANQLLRDVEELESRIGSVELKPAQVIAGAVELMNEAGSSKVTGEEERYSHLDLVDLYANVEGSRAAYGVMEATLRNNDPELADTINQRFDALNTKLETYRQGDSFVSYETLKQEGTRSISQAIDSAAEALAQAAIGIE